MKNIHILPTDKPSRLSILGSGKLDFGLEFISSSNSKAQHIYITSDEEIKQRRLRFIMDNRERMCGLIHQVSVVLDSKICPEIILTTDQDLIKYGVQAIDDEFLEWFVKNPSCERVKIERGKLQIDDDGQEYGFPDMSKYKIIIPKEEQKQDYSGVHLRHCYQGEYEDGCKYGEDDCPAKPLEPKQETLEEAAENEASIFYEKGTIEWNKYRQVFELGAKWQAERTYSEEDVYHILCEHTAFLFMGGKSTLTEWFEKYKKK